MQETRQEQNQRISTNYQQQLEIDSQYTIMTNC